VVVGWIILGVVVIVFSGVGIQEMQRRRLQRQVRKDQGGELVTFRTPVTLKLDPSVHATPRWALGAAGFRLVVREHSFSIVGISPRQSWYFQGSRASVVVDEPPTPWGSVRSWIVVSGNDEGNDGTPTRLWISPRNGDPMTAWDALVNAGVRPESEPPIPH
jgi:hypothetical protein